IKQYPSQPSTNQFLALAIPPIIHILYYHRIPFQSHPQNIILIHQNPSPTPIPLKHFHHPVRFNPHHLSQPPSHLTLNPIPQPHKKVNTNSFIQTHHQPLLPHFLHHPFFFINIPQIILFIQNQYPIHHHP
ncbi:ferric iron reductase, partial [Staphylococcus aureus]|uniref:ferric iron reductase n=1 Tax=Staphylococcus aureus TaxID=1280 RepID=UPI0028CB203C